VVTSKEISEMLKNKREGKIPEKEEFHEKIKMKKCPECKIENKEDAKFCIGCGIPFEEKETEIKGIDIKEKSLTKTCPSCKSKIPENAKFCVVCGATQKETKSPQIPDAALIENNFSKEEFDDKSINLVIQELNLNNEGLKFNRILKIKGWSDDLDQLEYGNIENIDFNEDILTIKTFNNDIEINGLDQDSGKEIILYIQEMIERIKPQIDPESMDKIQKAKDLLEAGAIDEQEFENIKRKIIEKIIS
jgi:hypothetical protein